METIDAQQVVARYIEDRFPSNSMAPEKIEKAEKAIAASRDRLKNILNDPNKREVILLDHLMSLWEGSLKDIFRRQ